ncbi:MAG: 2-amino-4-hydroxy-6-hydroxymethyldihydropteridine diphosphokinase [Candidatus Micrarchaeota archaeon]|nr:2-amino-4-hydroxy-6-hydroxymethyldihydropteridine diphosphokinase [Candidatus Micrarchaeota archaeon]MDE1823988.1 2-amino-4-hydroxy-6-hydroxymethyldihydropteridine diphosphokinase [Candidatus Micrarchaeota archaeon]
MHVAYIGIGSNVGDRLQNISRAISEMSKRSRVLAISRVYETKPMYVLRQPRFLNAAVKIRTSMPAAKLLRSLHSIEGRLGRTRKMEKRFGPRTIDLDILLFDSSKLNSRNLVIPHPRMHERAFVLVPLFEICRTKTIRTMLKKLPIKDVKGVKPFARA